MYVIKVTSLLALHILVVIAVIQDFRETRISNRLILSGLGASILLHILGEGVGHIYRIIPNIIIPVVLLYLFYLMGVIGPGDIKLFSLIGSFLSIRELIGCIVASFIFGAIISLGKLVYMGTLGVRIQSGLFYIFDLTRGNIRPYDRRSTDNIIHFSFAIMLGLVAVEIYAQM